MSRRSIPLVSGLLFCALVAWSQQPLSPLVASYEKHSQLKRSTPYQLEWVQLGPTLNGSRAEAVQGVSAQPGTFFAAFGSGGLWKTRDHGNNWIPIFQNQPSLGIGDFALAPSNPDIIYVGTGESLKKARNFTMPGTGIYKSINGGKDWISVGLEDTWHIGEIAIHPENPEVVLVAALGHFWSTNVYRGIFRTEDGGETWDHVLFLDNQTGANDVVFSPADPNIVYATLWENNPGVNGSKSGVYVSRDAGQSWEKEVEGININKNTGRIGIATSYQNPDKAYVFVDQRGTNKGGEVYQTTTGGDLWTKAHQDSLMSLSVIGWYFMDMYVDPLNDEEIYGLGVRIVHSTNGGQTFEYLGGNVRHVNPSPAQTLHLDHCELWINPQNPSELLLGNDGGIYHSYDKGLSWTHYNNIPTGEFYDIELDQQTPYQIYGGTQDDATVVGPAIEWNPNVQDRWQYFWIDAWSGGDGCITLVDPNDAHTVYFSMQNGGARRRNLQSGESVSIRPQFEGDSIQLTYNFITPYLLSPHQSNTVYMAGNYVMKSADRGDSWQLISPDLIKRKNHKHQETAAGAMAVSPFRENVLYIGTDRGTVWLTEDGGDHWKDISKGLPHAYIRNIVPSQHREGRLYVQLTGINYDDLSAYLFVSEDHGKSWQSITGNLPDHPVNTILEDPDHPDLLFAGTYRGVYVSENLGKSWRYLGNGMPDASIADLAIEPVSKDLIAATHGRGIYQMNLKPFYASLSQDRSLSHLYDLPDAVAPKRRDTHRDIEKSSIQKLPISFWTTSEETTQLQVFNQADSLIWTKDYSARKGLNQFRWDLTTERKTSMAPYFIHYESFLDPGTYILQLRTSGGIRKKTFQVIEK